MNSAHYAVGIDLGTSNCAVAHVRLNTDHATSEVHPVRQHFSADTVSDARNLPSFLFRASEPGSDWVAGLWARDMSFLQPDRVIHSAKSWLCHAGVDRQGKLLPWQSESIPASERLSPVDVSTRLLLHLRREWEEAMGCALKDQRVAITLPASFDAAAQHLTLEAALAAGYPESTLLMEEPQAAFYRWLETHTDYMDRFENGKTYTLLVMDVGGGTSDFSLFELTRNDEMDIRRTAVSDHVLLGGDNIDRFIASRLRQDLEQSGHSLHSTQWRSLLAESRRIKELLFTPDAVVPETVVLAAAGSSLFAESPTLPIQPDHLRAEILDAFFPSCPADAQPQKAKSGIREIGLPFAADGAVTRHLAAFLHERPPVDFLLCNGGTLSAKTLQERLADLIGGWQLDHLPERLEHSETDVAVARGAAVYAARLKSGKGLIEAGAARSVYLEIQDRDTRQSHPLCILPQGSPPDTVHRITEHPLRVTVDTPVRFQAWASSRRPEDQPGDLLLADNEDLQTLPTMQTQIAIDAKGPRPANNLVNVAIEAHCTPAGLLKVFLVSTDKKWKGRGNWELVFHLRAGNLSEEQEDNAPRIPKKIQQAGERIVGVMGKKADPNPRSARKLFKELEQILSSKRKDWDPVMCRQLWPSLREGLTRRNRSKDHEAAWLTLSGFTLRPGFGVELDSVRLNELWRLQELGLCFPKEARNRTQLWILWRRVAGGLDAERQQRIADQWLGALKGGGEISLELIRLSGALERVSADEKRKWISQHLTRLPKAPQAEVQARAWALGRLLGRLPFGGGPEDILPPDDVTELFHRIQSKPAIDGTLPELQQALIAAARITNDIHLDVSEDIRNDIQTYLLKHGADENTLAPLSHYIPEQETERALRFGESLPPGLTLAR
jgi:molecular chaperone DnaK (HSP70)